MQAKIAFMNQLKAGLSAHPDKQAILAEYDCHLTEVIDELKLEGIYKEQQLLEGIENRLGTPQEILSMWKEELGATPRKAQLTFLYFNLLLFIGGILLTYSYNVLDWKWINFIWNGLSSAAIGIMFIYLFFWGLLGYEMGKEFGARGRSLLFKTFALALIPNMTLMYLTLFKVIPSSWFDPLLSPSFIILCILFTVFLFPVSLVGFKWGKKYSI